MPSFAQNISPLASGLSGGKGLWDKISRGLFGDEDKMIKESTLTPGQGGALEQLLAQLGGGGQAGLGQAQNYYSDILGGGQDAFNRFAAPHRQRFEQQTVPRLAERFAGLGGGLGGGALSSSGFGQALGGAGAQFESDLSGLYAGLQQNAAGALTNQYNQMANLGLGTRAFENLYQPGSTGIFGGLSQGFSQGAGQAGGAAALMKLLPLLGII